MKMTIFLKRVENTVGKGEIACYKQVLLFPQCFQKTSTTRKKTRKNQGLFRKGLIVILDPGSDCNFLQSVLDLRC